MKAFDSFVARCLPSGIFSGNNSASDGSIQVGESLECQRLFVLLFVCLMCESGPRGVFYVLDRAPDENKESITLPLPLIFAPKGRPENRLVFYFGYCNAAAVKKTEKNLDDGNRMSLMVVIECLCKFTGVCRVLSCEPMTAV